MPGLIARPGDSQQVNVLCSQNGNAEFRSVLFNLGSEGFLGSVQWDYWR